MDRTLPDWVRCFEDVVCLNCIHYMKHPDPNETMEGFCKRKCDAEIEVKWDNWCGEGEWVWTGLLMSADKAALYISDRATINKEKGCL